MYYSNILILKFYSNLTFIHIFILYFLKISFTSSNINKYINRNTMAVVRFGVSLQEEQLEALDNYVRDSRFANRSRAFRQLISKNLVENKWQHILTYLNTKRHK